MSRRILFRMSLSVMAIICFAAAMVYHRSASAEGGVKEVRLRDDCDPVTFGALCPVGNGDTTLDEFNAELAQKKSVGAWKFNPDLSGLSIHVGEPIIIVNRGGETHSFTKVAQFGGGRVPRLNEASGNPIPAPECLAPPNMIDNIFVGGKTTAPGPVAGDLTAPLGRTKFQCCIHPWMRTTVRVQQ
jgi:hypothetical protein